MNVIFSSKIPEMMLKVHYPIRNMSCVEGKRKSQSLPEEAPSALSSPDSEFVQLPYDCV